MKDFALSLFILASAYSLLMGIYTGAVDATYGISWRRQLDRKLIHFLFPMYPFGVMVGRILFGGY